MQRLVLYMSYRGKSGKTTSYYVPVRSEAQIRQVKGVEAWSQLHDRLRELADLPGQSEKITTNFATAFPTLPAKRSPSEA